MSCPRKLPYKKLLCFEFSLYKPSYDFQKNSLGGSSFGSFLSRKEQKIDIISNFFQEKNRKSI